MLICGLIFEMLSSTKRGEIAQYFWTMIDTESG